MSVQEPLGNAVHVVTKANVKGKKVLIVGEKTKGGELHIKNVKNPIVSFGQGCEGEPLLQSTVIEKAIEAIRRETSKGTIHMNSNGSKPDSLARLLDAGLDSVRISLNSARKSFYLRYYYSLSSRSQYY